MISVQDAIAKALASVKPLDPKELPLTDSLGHILAEDVLSDIDMPPFDKSSMDGYAVRAKDVEQVPARLEVIETIAAGMVPKKAVQPGQASKIMTGAPLPDGSDSVQMVEKTELSGMRVDILESVPAGKNVARRAEIMQKGARVLSKGQLISPAVIGVLATVGRATPLVYKRPRIAVLVTGDELVEVERSPAPGQIRNSNGYNLVSQLNSLGLPVTSLGIAADDLADLREKLIRGFNFDLLLISGGVSMGDFDFVENVLSEFDVTVLYSKVNIKPGKPTVFGTSGTCVVFGLPGNPVSASTIFDVIVKPVLRKMMGHTRFQNNIQTAILDDSFQNKTQRMNYHPAATEFIDGVLHAKPVPSRGSADVLAYSMSNSYLIANKGGHMYEPGSEIEVMLRDEFWQA